MAQNISHAVMAQRFESKESADDFPTPPWASRALIECIIKDKENLNDKTCLEPACGRNYMVHPLSKYFRKVDGFDKYQYGDTSIRDFLTYPYGSQSYDWVVTNPPFRLAEQFIKRALDIAREGVAILARTVFLESVGRYERIYENTPPTIVAQFSERVPIIKGKVDAKASSATGYAWFVWEKGEKAKFPRIIWIPPCRKKLEKQGDYISC